MKKSLFRIASVLALLLLLWNPPLAFQGAKSGLVLWACIVVPTLMPFMVCSNVIVALDAIHILTWPFRFLLKHILYLSDAGSYVLISGLLCGYPMGAKTCSEFMDTGKISVSEGRYLLSIANHPSPMFLLGYVVSQLPGLYSLPRLLLSVYLPVFLVAWMARKSYKISGLCVSGSMPDLKKPTFDESLMSSCDVMIKIGGYIMIFSIAAAYITKIPINNPLFKAVLLGLIEITTGIQALAFTIPGDLGELFIVMSVCFGGLSGIFQTKSVIKNAGLSIRHYVIWKGVHSVLSCAFFILLTNCLPSA